MSGFERIMRRRTPQTLAYLREQGWDMRTGTGGHVVAVSPTGRRTTLSTSPSCQHTDVAQVRRLTRLDREAKS